MAWYSNHSKRAPLNGLVFRQQSLVKGGRAALNRLVRALGSNYSKRLRVAMTSCRPVTSQASAWILKKHYKKLWNEGAKPRQVATVKQKTSIPVRCSLFACNFLTVIQPKLLKCDTSMLLVPYCEAMFNLYSMSYEWERPKYIPFKRGLVIL